MSEASSRKTRFVAALRVREHARRGFVVGVVFAVALYALSVAQSGALSTRLLYLSLLIVLALTTGTIVTTVLVAAEAYKL
ncbi:MAG: DUF7536 family protein, partial [Halorhabdus sp.]